MLASWLLLILGGYWMVAANSVPDGPENAENQPGKALAAADLAPVKRKWVLQTQVVTFSPSKWRAHWDALLTPCAPNSPPFFLFCQGGVKSLSNKLQVMMHLLLTSLDRM